MQKFIAAAMFVFASGGSAQAITIGADFVANYTADSLGSVPGLPASYGGLTFLDNDTILIGGGANGAGGLIYQIDVTRDGSGTVNGFAGSASVHRSGSFGAFNDGGLAFGPDGVLFYTRFPLNEIAQVRAGSTVDDRVINLTALGVASSVGSLAIVPDSFAGAGSLKISSFSASTFYDADLVADGNGTFDISNVTLTATLTGGLEGIVYVDGANPGFGTDSLLATQFSAGTVSVFDIDSDGNPIASTTRLFLSGLSGAEGAAIDPLTGDFLFSTFGGGNQLVVVSGFTVAPPPPPPPPPPPVSTPGALALLGLGFLALAGQRRR